MSLQYRIAEIGWYNFERLVQTLLKAIIGPGVTFFGGSKDRGRDAAYAGSALFPTTQENWSGNWVFQVKYIDLQDAGAVGVRSRLKAALRVEIQGILLRRDDPVDNYILITDVPLTADTRDELNEIALQAGVAGRFRAIDGHEVCEFLTLHPEIRRSYPQLLGLADLCHIINTELYARSQAYLEQWQPRLAVFVQTEAYVKALTTLRQHHFLVLDGPPEAGKTMIAAAVALLYATDGYEVIDLRGPGEVFTALPARSRQIFVADDAIGSINLSPSLVDAWSRDLPGILRKLDADHLLIWTARHYILEEALAESRLGESVGDFPGTREVLVEVGELSAQQKAEMLYNHAKLAGLATKAKTLIRNHFRAIIDHPNFTPERVRQLCEEVLRADKADSWAEISKFMNNPSERWRKAFDGLSTSEQALLTALLDFDDDAELNHLRQAYEQRIQDEHKRSLPFDKAISRLRHSFLQISRSYLGTTAVEFRHPSLRDMLLERLRDDARARKRYIELTTPAGLAAMVRGMGSEGRDCMEEHYVFPKGSDETKLVVGRILELSRNVITPADWLNLLSAAETVLPRRNGKLVKPSDLDLIALRSQPHMALFAAVLQAVGSEETYRANRRYQLRDWLRIARSFADLSLYVVPPAMLGYAVDLCLFAIKAKAPMDSIVTVNALSLVDTRVVRQLVSEVNLDKWSCALIERLEEVCGTGDEIQANNDGEDPFDPDVYENWLTESKTLVRDASEFYEWSAREEPEKLSLLRSLVDSVDRPPDPDVPEDEDREYGYISSPSSYWTLERMFEDL